MKFMVAEFIPNLSIYRYIVLSTIPAGKIWLKMITLDGKSLKLQRV